MARLAVCVVPLSFTLTGAGAASFSLGSSSQGCARLVSAAAFNFEAVFTPFTVNLTVCDNGSPVLCASAIVSVTVTNVNEAPVFPDSAIGVSENAGANVTVGSPIVATDPDASDSVTFAITSGSAITSIFYLIRLSDRVAQIMTQPTIPTQLRWVQLLLAAAARPLPFLLYSATFHGLWQRRWSTLLSLSPAPPRAPLLLRPAPCSCSCDAGTCPHQPSPSPPTSSVYVSLTPGACSWTQFST